MGKDDDNVRVVVRCRPMNTKETESNFKQVVFVDELRGSITINNNHHAADPPKQFNFDFVFGSESKQVDIYNKIARPIVDFVLEGYNGTIFAYGQTGTGKTFTMEGVRNVPELRGIIPNSFAHIFGYIAKSEKEAKFLVRVAYLEIYNEEIRDLLKKDQGVRLEVKERPDTGVFVKDLSEFTVHNADDMDRMMTYGNKNRSVGATMMNAHSSRSHAIFTITVECCETLNSGRTLIRQGKLHLVDLAGSERQSKTGASGQRLKEATKINLSLSTLGNVISALVDGKSTHIPYRNSKLTRLLQDSLGGNSKTLMIANCGPADYNFEESVSTLRYANRAKNIKNNAKINEDPKDALLRQFQLEIEKLKKQLEGGEYPSGEEEDEEDDSEEEEEEEIGPDGQVRIVRKKKKKKGSKLSKERRAEIQRKIEADRKLLEEKKDMEEEERNRVMAHLTQKESELQHNQEEHKAMQQRLEQLNKKIIVGGENLLEKAEAQERLLQESAAELEDAKKKEEEIRKELEEKEAVRLDIEDKYTNLQEEAQGKTKKLKKLWTMYRQSKAELEDLRQEHQREMEGLLENVRNLSRDLRLQMLIIESFVPDEFQKKIEDNVHWNDDIGEWQLRCVAYTGNNMRRQAPPEEKEAKPDETDLSHVYLAYSKEGEKGLSKMRAFGSAKKAGARPKTAEGRPKTGRKKRAEVEA